MEELEYSQTQEIQDIQVSKPHVVILGAGASRAALPQGDCVGNLLPVMDDLVEICRLDGILASAGFDTKRNFEELYSEISISPNSTV
ncbi:MAG: hypothetical protein ABI282_08560 [Candidatus Baltobacteraceae bacterium]